jgi:hypothetical protein
MGPLNRGNVRSRLQQPLETSRNRQGQLGPTRARKVGLPTQPWIAPLGYTLGLHPWSGRSPSCTEAQPWWERPRSGQCVELPKRVRPSIRRSGPFHFGPVFRHRFAAHHYRANCSTQPASADIAVRIAIKISAFVGPRRRSRLGSSGFRSSAMSHFQSGRANPWPAGVFGS